MLDVDITREGTTAVVTLRRPESLNAFDVELVEQLDVAIGRLAAEDPAVAVIAGAGRAFSVGAALDQVLPSSPEQNLEHNERLRDAFDAVAALPIPTIAAIDGFAVGGGLELALACTLRVCSEDARLGLPEVRLGLMPGAGGTERLPRLIPRSAALRLLLTGDLVDAETALRLSLVDAVAPSGGALEGALGIAERIAAAGPLAVRAILATTGELSPAGAGPKRAPGLDRRLAELLASDDATEGIRAQLEHRTPRFTGS